jgi:hypothetical protein
MVSLYLSAIMPKIAAIEVQPIAVCVKVNPNGGQQRSFAL